MSPVYKHSLTGEPAELSRDYAEKGFADGTWTLVEEEGPTERTNRELREAMSNKVTVEDAYGNEQVPTDEHPPVGHVLQDAEEEN